MALALVLDTADGRLARLQGTSSAFGRWLDQFLDELADLALHAAIAWSAFARDGRPDLAAPRHRLRLGEVPVPRPVDPGRGAGASHEWPPDRSARRRSRPVASAVAAEARRGRASDRSCRRPLASLDRPGRDRGRLDVALAAYAVYFPARTLAGGDQEGGAPCLSPGSRS